MNPYICWDNFSLYSSQYQGNYHDNYVLHDNIVSANPIQPINGIYVFFTGTIYNIEKLKKDFQINGDDPSTVIAALYLKVKEKIPMFLEGTYSVVIFDGAKLLLFRDRFSVENLFYFRDDREKSFIISSSIEDIKKLKKLEVNEKTLPKYFLFHQINGKLTLFKDIFTLETFEMILVDLKSNSWTSFKYDDFAYQPLVDQNLDDNTIVEKTDTILRECVRSLVDAYPNAQFVNSLSGGTDSSLLSVYLNILGNPIAYTYSHTPPENRDTRKYSTGVSSLLHLDHRIKEVEPEDLLPCLEEGVKICGQPLIFEGETLFTGTLATIAEGGKKEQKEVVIFFGSGADTVAGHGRALLELKYLSSVPLRYLFGIFNQSILRFLNPPASKRYRGIIDAMNKNNFDAEFLSILFTNEREIQLVKEIFQLEDTGSLFEYEYQELLRHKNPLIEKIYRLGLFEYEVIRGNNIMYHLAKSQGLLMVFPYTTLDLVKFYFNIPTPRKIRYKGIVSLYSSDPFKYYLKRLLERYLPKNIVYRKKIPQQKYTSFNGIIEQQKQFAPLVDEIKKARYPYFHIDFNASADTKFEYYASKFINFHIWYKNFIGSNDSDVNH
jgi:asparagine synthase (glutamine-hydrolysing)